MADYYRKKHSPFIQLGSSKNKDIDQFFDVFFGSHRPPLMHSEIGWHPASDMYETNSHFVIIVEISGISGSDLDLVLDKNVLTLRGLRKENTDDEKRQYYKMEIPYGPFERVYNLPSPVNPEKVHAHYKSGFLSIRLEKQSKPLKKRTTIKIK